MYNYWNSFLQRSRHQCYVMGIDIFIFNIIHSKRISYHSFNFVCVCVWVSTMTTNGKANTTTTDAKKIRKNKNRCFLGFSTSNGVRVSIRFYSGFYSVLILTGLRRCRLRWITRRQNWGFWDPGKLRPFNWKFQLQVSGLQSIARGSVLKERKK